MIDGVELRPIPGVVGYAAGSDGRVYTFRKRAAPNRWGSGHKYTTMPRPLQGGTTRWGYIQVRIYWRGCHRLMAHRLICSAFHGPCPEGKECSHLNGNPSDNRPDNLRWESKKRNVGRKRDHGTLSRTGSPGESNPGAKLSEDDVRKIRILRSQGRTLEELAKLYGISNSQTSSIALGRSWSHVPFDASEEAGKGRGE